MVDNFIYILILLFKFTVHVGEIWNRLNVTVKVSSDMNGNDLWMPGYRKVCEQGYLGVLLFFFIKKNKLLWYAVL